MATVKVTNISDGPRGVYLKGEMKMVEAGEEAETDEDVNEEWFARSTTKAAKEAEKAAEEGEGAPG